VIAARLAGEPDEAPLEAFQAAIEPLDTENFAT
jgi:hypothetical protein